MIHRIRILLRLQTKCAVLEILGATLAGNRRRIIYRLCQTFLVRWIDLRAKTAIVWELSDTNASDNQLYANLVARIRHIVGRVQLDARLVTVHLQRATRVTMNYATCTNETSIKTRHICTIPLQSPYAPTNCRAAAPDAADCDAGWPVTQKLSS